MKNKKPAKAFHQIYTICELLKDKPKVVNFSGKWVKIDGKRFYSKHYYLAKAGLKMWKSGKGGWVHAD